MATVPTEAILLDTTILVDFLRGHVAAAEFLDTARAGAQLGCSAVTVAELVVGTRTRAEQRAVEQLLARFDTEPITSADSTRALNWLRKYHHSRGVGFHDCLIAATAVRLQAAVATLNDKRFEQLPGVGVYRPY